MGKNQVVRIRSFRGLLETPEAHFGYDPAAPILLPTVPKVALAAVPRAVIATRQTTMIRASMTAYSTAVGPSSAFRNSTTIRRRLLMGSSLRLGRDSFYIPLSYCRRLSQL